MGHDLSGPGANQGRDPDFDPDPDFEFDFDFDFDFVVFRRLPEKVRIGTRPGRFGCLMSRVADY